MKWIEFRKPFEKVNEGEYYFAIIAFKRIPVEFRTIEVPLDLEGIGRIRKTEARVVYLFIIDLWLFVLRINFSLWLPEKQLR